jgi:(p)ppGpp synthase/HD superfamily hydrolase
MHGYCDRVNHAFAFAAKHYRMPADATAGMVYLAHPANVAVILTRYGCDEPTVVAGILHHVLEDALPARRGLLEQKIAEKFGPVVLAVALDACETRYGERAERPWRARKHELLGHLAVAEPRALDIIAADEIHHCGSTITALRRLGAEYLRAVSQASSEETIWWYYSMVEILVTRLDWPQRAMLEEIRSLGATLVRSLQQREEEL